MIKIAYCPTMQPYADLISKNVKEVEMLEGNAAASVLAALRTGQVDGVLIGRNAKEYEIDEETHFARLKKGITLVYMQKAMVDENQLSTIPVKTYLEKDKVGDMIQYFQSVDWRDSFEDCFKDGLDIPALIDWDDYRDNFELLIPVNRFGKTPVFRAPVIYYKNINESTIEKIGKAVNG